MRGTSVCACLLILLTAVSVHGSGPASSPSSQPAAPQLSDRQAFILLQLANAEANIKAINKALVRTGYKVGLAYEQKEGGEKANELMDRKGGGPVPWDQFYGTTALSFYHQASGELHYDAGHHAQMLDAQWQGATLTPIGRPTQFDSIYKANEQQIAHAQEQIATLLKDQAALLARRQKHEADQCALWAQLALEPVKDQEIAYQPLYRFKLEPAGAKAELLRGPVLFLRTANKVVSEALEQIDQDQATALADLHQGTKEAYASLLGSMADALLGGDIVAEDRTEATALKLTCKQIAEECAICDENYRRAIDSEKAKEDGSKLEYRAALQASLAKGGARISILDEQIKVMANQWAIKPQTNTPSPDRLPDGKLAVRPSVESSPTATRAIASTDDKASSSAKNTEAPTGKSATPTAVAAVDEKGWFRLFRASGASIWNTNTDIGEDSYAVTLDQAPDDLKYLRMLNVSSGRYVIIVMNKETLGKNRDIGGYRWNGAKTKSNDHINLGIGNLAWGAHYRDAEQCSIMGQRGWGWGTCPPGLTYPDAAFCWDGEKKESTVIEISVKSGKLSSEEARHVLR